MYKLMIKTSNQGLRYLCITKRKDYKKYKGSGSYWKNHLSKYGDDITTEVIFETDDHQKLSEAGIYYSNLYNVVESNEWANQVPEKGYETGVGKTNLNLWWEYTTDDRKKSVIEKRNKSIKENHFTKTEHRDDVCKKISESMKLITKHMNTEERLEYTKKLREGGEKWRKNLSDEDKETYSKNVSKGMKKYFANLSDDEKIALSLRNSKQRMNMSEEGKLERKRKIQEVYKTGKHQDLFDRYSAERKGAGNPSAKKVYVDGVIYDCIKDAYECLGITRAVINGRIKSEKYPNYYKIEKVQNENNKSE